ncbi:MAG: cupin domain-containing protein [Lachnospiraceae bacterium]|nr:cupin domain-containing protein [Lachnospiraceae bacterium]
MKCIILAGGTGDRLWPLSRKNYPKQFLHYGADRSVFRDTVVRNMPFCEEFIITTREEYQPIIEGELINFQGLSYRVETETPGLGTALSVYNVCKGDHDLILITSSDLLIEGSGYQDAIVEAKELAESGKIVLFGVSPRDARDSVGYFTVGDSINFITHPTKEEAARLSYDRNTFWNAGMVLAREDVLLEAFKNDITPGTSLERAIIVGNPNLSHVRLEVSWNDLSDYEGYILSMLEEGEDTYIKENSEGTIVINTDPSQLVVTNNLMDSLVVNTPDAVYITPRRSADNIRNIMNDKTNESRFGEYFEYGKKIYRPWGTREVIKKEPGFRVRRVEIYPGMHMSRHAHENRTENYSVVSGALSVQLEDEFYRLETGESINILPGKMHRLYNDDGKPAVIIEVDTGAEIEEQDMVMESAIVLSGDVIPLSPAFKDYLWGGERIREMFHPDAPKELSIISEAWELSAHPDGQSIITEGSFKGQLFGDFMKEHKKELCGWKSEVFDRFPVLIKLIDARNALSIQIHPADDYAFKNEGEFGKNEVWYVMDNAPGAYLYCGLKEDTSREVIEQKIKDNTVEELLNRIEVKRGDVIFVPAGTIHAIGAGLLICEIQQSSNSTYRMYDYDRIDKDGNKRPLHIRKAMDVVNETAYYPETKGFREPVKRHGFTEQLIVQCKYFRCMKYDIDGECSIPVDDSSFKSVLVLSGKGKMQSGGDTTEYKLIPGSSFFVPAGRKLIHITGKCEVIVTNI